jgi:hypothetical protein
MVLAGEDEIELQKFAFEYADRILTMAALPYTSDRSALFDDLSSATVVDDAVLA